MSSYTARIMSRSSKESKQDDVHGTCNNSTATATASNEAAEVMNGSSSSSSVLLPPLLGDGDDVTSSSDTANDAANSSKGSKGSKGGGNMSGDYSGHQQEGRRSVAQSGSQQQYYERQRGEGNAAAVLGQEPGWIAGIERAGDRSTTANNDNTSSNYHNNTNNNNANPQSSSLFGNDLIRKRQLQRPPSSRRRQRSSFTFSLQQQQQQQQQSNKLGNTSPTTNKHDYSISSNNNGKGGGGDAPTSQHDCSKTNTTTTPINREEADRKVLLNEHPSRTYVNDTLATTTTTTTNDNYNYTKHAAPPIESTLSLVGTATAAMSQQAKSTNTSSFFGDVMQRSITNIAVLPQTAPTAFDTTTAILNDDVNSGTLLHQGMDHVKDKGNSKNNDIHSNSTSIQINYDDKTNNTLLEANNNEELLSYRNTYNSNYNDNSITHDIQSNDEASHNSPTTTSQRKHQQRQQQQQEEEEEEDDESTSLLPNILTSELDFGYNFENWNHILHSNDDSSSSNSNSSSTTTQKKKKKKIEQVDNNQDCSFSHTQNSNDTIVLDSCHDHSPHWYHTNTSFISPPSTKSINDTDATTTTTASGNNNALDCWNIKCKLKIECHPSHCLPGNRRRSREQHQQHVISHFLNMKQQQQQQRQQQEHNQRQQSNGVHHEGCCNDDFTPCKKDKNDEYADNASAAAAADLWEAGCMYWQHPSTCAMPSYLMSSSSTSTSKPTSAPLTAANKKIPSLKSIMSMENQFKSIMEAGATLLRHVRIASSIFGNTIFQEGSKDINNNNKNRKSHFTNHNRNNNEKNGIISELEQQNSKKKNCDEALTFVRQRRMEWMVAIHSIYDIYLQRIHDSNNKKNCACCHDDDNDHITTTITSSFTTPYFYALTSKYVILFTTTTTTTTMEVDQRQTTSPLLQTSSVTTIPQVRISCSTRQLRMKLRQMGVSLYDPRGNVLMEAREGGRIGACASALNNEKRNVLECNDINDDTITGDKNDEERALLEDMETMRTDRTWSMGGKLTYAGAEVNIQEIGTTTRNKKKRVRDTLLSNEQEELNSLGSPLQIYGWNDCHAFFEVLMNTTGQIMDILSSSMLSGELSAMQHNGCKDVPVLLCRSSIGPFINASLKKLTVVSQKYSERTAEIQIANKSRLDEVGKTQNRNVDEAENVSLIEVKGPILPCAARQLISASVQTLLADEGRGQDCRTESNEEPIATRRDDGFSDSADVGSHYLVAHLTPQGNTFKEHNSGQSRTTGSSCSRWFNGWKTTPSRNIDPICDDSVRKSCVLNTSDGEHQLERGEILSMVVWNSACPSDLPYRTEGAQLSAKSSISSI